MSAQKALYDEDFYLWTQRAAELLRAGRPDQVDLENVAEEIESLGKSDKRELRSRLKVLIMHLLNCQQSSEVPFTKLAAHHSQPAQRDPHAA